MYIKEIKINGFKSFADKINIELNENFTCIVGPNGSGKSNIVDAIKWVLGEQSIKTLRGTNNMSDIIFSGSKSREPKNSASVSIIFDNSDHSLKVDFDEVQIKRIVYRSGENEYYINGEKCRLKDISDLLLDNFSTKDGINIIAQGKVSELLSSKAEDRRIIIEEASGVLIYKKRKEECLRKLEKTHDNLEKINMIVDELERQVIPLQEESQKALSYKNIKSKLEKVDIALMVKDINESVLLLEDAKEKLAIANESRVHFSSFINTEEVKQEENKVLLIKYEEQKEDLKNELLEVTRDLGDIKNKKEILLERKKYDKNSDDVQNNLLKAQEKEFKISNEIMSLEAAIKIKEEEKNSIKKELSDFEIEKLNVEKGIDSVRTKWNDIIKEEIELNNQKKIIENNLNNNNFLPYGVKYILNNKDLKGIHNIIGSLYSTSDKYSEAIITSLGANINNIVTTDENAAKEAIKLLKVNKKGRATFYPLDVIKPRSIQDDILGKISSDEGFIGVASSLIKCDIKYNNIFDNLLGQIIITDNLDNGTLISKKLYNRYRIVTLDGDVINIGGSLTGGSHNDKNSTGSLRNELKKTEVKLKKISETKIENEKEEKRLSNSLGIIEDNIYKHNIDFVSLTEFIFNKNVLLNEDKNELIKVQEEIKDLSNNDNINDVELNKIMDFYYSKEQLKNTLEMELEQLDKNIREIKDVINESESLIRKSNNDERSKLEEINKLEVIVTKNNFNADSLLNKLNEEYNMTYEKAKNNYILDIDEEEARNKVNNYKTLLRKIGNVNLNSIEEYERVNKRYQYLNNEKNDLLKSEDNILKVIGEMDSIMIDKFSKTFDKINIEFNKVFKELFIGGSAYLKLTDPDNLLTSGIEIIANPPGKRPNAISLLSGGEKTLTAISLLFSVMNLKKLPFVIFDEVESALDEANVDRFGKYINNYKGKTQLLIITHKKKTMEYVDLLYGITMEESGVSKLVSVKLEN